MLTIALTSLLVLWTLVIVLVLGLCVSARTGDAGAHAGPTKTPVASLATSSHPDRETAPPRRAATWKRHAENPAQIARAGGAVG
jgi:hypothetical protein